MYLRRRRYLSIRCDMTHCRWVDMNGKAARMSTTGTKYGPPKRWSIRILCARDVKRFRPARSWQNETPPRRSSPNRTDCCGWSAGASRAKLINHGRPSGACAASNRRRRTASVVHRHAPRTRINIPPPPPPPPLSFNIILVSHIPTTGRRRARIIMVEW